MALREFADQAGKTWLVWETKPPSQIGLAVEFHGGWLTFDCGSERRRLAPVPADWEAFPQDRLVLLLRMAAPHAGQRVV